jgi:putative CocE/NonD family hydrolase
VGREPGRVRHGRMDGDAALDDYAYRLRWYDHWLKGIENGMMDGPLVRIVLVGENRWLEMGDWPPSEVTYRLIYLREGIRKNHRSLNSGGLTFELPEGAEQPDNFLYDLQDPVPSVRTFEDSGPKDFRSIEERVLTCTSDVLESSLTVIGPVKAVLYGRSSAPDTDWVVRLCDVWPDRRSMWVWDGMFRARFRNSFEREEMMVPGQTSSADSSHEQRFPAVRMEP